MNITELGYAPGNIWVFWLLPCFGFATLFLTAAAIIAAHKAVSRVYSDWDDVFAWFTGAAIIGLVGTIVVGLIFLTAMQPYQDRYWHQYVISGTVQRTDAQVTVGDDESVTGQYLVSLGGDNLLFTTDQRVMRYIGKRVQFLCGLNWQYQASDYWVCDVRSAS